MGALAGVRVGGPLTDGQAGALRRLGGDAGCTKRLDAVQLAPGFGFTERSAGTNGSAPVETSPCSSPVRAL